MTQQLTQILSSQQMWGFELSNSNEFLCVLEDPLKSVILIKVVKLSFKIYGFIVRLPVGF